MMQLKIIRKTVKYMSTMRTRTATATQGNSRSSKPCCHKSKIIIRFNWNGSCWTISSQQMCSKTPGCCRIYSTPGGRYITIHCNFVKRRVTKEATLKVCRTVWFDEGAISNIICFISIR